MEKVTKVVEVSDSEMKQQIEEVVNNLKVVGTITELRKQIGEHFGWTTDKTRHRMNRIGVEVNQDETTLEWSSPTTEERIINRNGDGFDMVDETLKIVEMKDSGLSFKQIGETLGRHQGEIGRKFRFGQLLVKYKSVQNYVTGGKISSGRIYQIQRSTKQFEKDNGTTKGLTLQKNLVEELIKSSKLDKGNTKGIVKDSHYEHLKSVETLPQDVVSGLMKILHL